MNKKILFNNIFWGLIVLSYFLRLWLIEHQIQRKLSPDALQKLSTLEFIMSKSIEENPIIRSRLQLDFQFDFVDDFNLSFLFFPRVSDSVCASSRSTLGNFYKKESFSVFRLQSRCRFFHKNRLVGVDKESNLALLRAVDGLTYQDLGHTRRNAFNIVFVNDNFSPQIFIQDGVNVVIRARATDLENKGLLRDVLTQAVFRLKRLDRLKSTHELIFPKTPFNPNKTLRTLWMNFILYRLHVSIKGFINVHQNRNTVFYPKYLRQLERVDVPFLSELNMLFINDSLNEDTLFYHLRKNLHIIRGILEKDELMIYENVYLFESYFYSMLVATLGIVFQSLIRFVIPIVRRFLGLSTDQDKKKKEGLFYKVLDYLLEIE